MHVPKRIVVGALVCLVLLMGLHPVWADDPWDEKDLDPEALRASLDAIRQEMQLLGEGSEEEKQRKELLTARSERLQELLKSVEDQAALPDLEELARRKAAAETALAHLQAEDSTRDPVVARTKEDLAAYDAIHQETATAAALVERKHKEREQERKALDAELRDSLPNRLARARQAVEALQGQTETALDRMRLGNARLAERSVEARKAYATTALTRLGALIEVLGIEREGVVLARDRAKARLAEASDQVSAELERARRDAEERAVRKDQEKEQETDPLRRFEKDVEAQLEKAGAAEARDKELEISLDRDIQRERDATERVQREAELFRHRLEAQSGSTERIGERLQTTMRQLKRSRAVIRNRRIPELQRQLEQTLTARAEVQDRIWELDIPLEDDPSLFVRLIDSLGAKDDVSIAAAREAYEGASTRLREVLRGRERTLGNIEAKLSELMKWRLERLQALEAQQAFILGHIYWVRTDPPISFATLEGARDDLKRFVSFYALGDFRETSGESGEARPLATIAAIGWIGGGFLALLVVWRKRRHWRWAWIDQGGPLRVVLQRVLAAAVASALLPLYLFVTAQLLLGLKGQGPALHPICSALELLAVALLVHGFAARLLADDGRAPRHLGLTPELARQVMRTVDWAAFSWVLFLVPWGIFRAEPFQFTHVTRLLYTGFLLGMAVALSLLLRRKGPLLQALLRRAGFLRGLWRLLGPLLMLALFGIALLDAMGYRVGARLLIENVGQTLLTALLIVCVYVGLRSAVQALAQRARARAAADSDRRTAIAVSDTVLTQLTRVSIVVIVVLTVLVLARFWDVDDALRSVLQKVHLATVESGSSPEQNVYLTLWDVVVALMWIVGAHFFVRNIQGVLEVLVFPAFVTDAGSRYVLATFARYAILLVAYSAALLALKFSFSSIGWLLAAASVGLGFGLQEIVANFVSGVILLIEQPVRVGDTIQVGNTWGVVDKISTRSTVMTNYERQVVIIPNKSLITENVVNWTRNDQVMRRTLRVGVAYGSDVEKVLRLLEEIVRADRRIRKDPKPRYLFQAFGDSSLDFEVWFFASVDDGLAVRSDLNAEIVRRFRAEGITIPFPQRDLHLDAAGWNAPPHPKTEEV